MALFGQTASLINKTAEDINQLGVDSDDEEFKLEKPTLNAEQAQELNTNILSAMDAAHNIAKEIENPQELDDGTLEMILFLTQKAISDIKELH